MKDSDTEAQKGQATYLKPHREAGTLGFDPFARHQSPHFISLLPRPTPTLAFASRAEPGGKVLSEPQ